MRTSDLNMKKPEMFSCDEARGVFPSLRESVDLYGSARGPNEMMNGSVRDDEGSLSTGGW